MPRTRRKQAILLDRSGEVDNGTKESIKKTGRRAEQLAPAHRASATTDKLFSRIGRAVACTIDFSTRTVERLAASVREIGQTIKRKRSQ
ncbi:MAG: hypothetical protein ACI8VC_002601 [Candidatus Endobugula sp.]|jgi:hypothetical protein